jgi:hypothetical protein
LLHVGAFNLSLVLRKLLGTGTPRELKNRAGQVFSRLLRFLLCPGKAVSRIPLLARGGHHRGLAAYLITARDFSVVLPRAVSTTVLSVWSSTKRTTGELSKQNPGDGLSERGNRPGIMPLEANPAIPEGGTGAAFRGGIVPVDGHERRGKTVPFGHQEPIGRNTESSVMMKTPPASSFIMTQAKFLLQFFVIPLDDPAVLGHADQGLEFRLGRERREPVPGRFGFFAGPFDQQPLLGIGLTAFEIAVSRTAAHGRETRLERVPGRQPTGDSLENVETLKAQRLKLQHALERLIDSFTESLIEKDQFTSRLARTKSRIAELDAKIKEDAGDTDHLEHLRLASKRLRELATAVGPHLATADWHRRRDIIRTLVQRIEIGREVIKIVFRVTQDARGSGPESIVITLSRV